VKYPALRDFLRGYLHEDTRSEHGTARAAAEAFVSESDQPALEAVQAEWQALLREVTKDPLDAINDRLQELGCRWVFRNRQELEELTGALRIQKVQ